MPSEGHHRDLCMHALHSLGMQSLTQHAVPHSARRPSLSTQPLTGHAASCVPCRPLDASGHLRAQHIRARPDHLCTVHIWARTQDTRVLDASCYTATQGTHVLDSPDASAFRMRLALLSCGTPRFISCSRSAWPGGPKAAAKAP